MLERAKARCKELRDRLYPKSTRPGIRCKEKVLSLASPDKVLVEIGCGRDADWLRQMRPHFARCIGLDIEISPNGDASQCWLVCADVNHLPLDAGQADVVTLINAMEHFADPVVALRECGRILRPGGVVIILTVNKWFMPVVAGRLFPHRLRQKINSLATHSEPRDTFPAYYRANTQRDLERCAQNAGLRPVQIEYVSAHPEYFQFSVIAYRLWALWERCVLRRPLFAGWRHFILCCLEK